MERRPPKRDLENYPHLPLAEVALTRPADYQLLPGDPAMDTPRVLLEHLKQLRLLRPWQVGHPLVSSLCDRRNRLQAADHPEQRHGSSSYSHGSGRTHWGGWNNLAQAFDVNYGPAESRIGTITIYGTLLKDRH